MPAEKIVAKQVPESLLNKRILSLDLMAVLAGAAQFWQSKMMLKKNPATKKGQVASMASAMGKQMTYFMPVITVFIGASLPAGLTLYWFLITLLGAVQQWWVFKKLDQIEVKK